MAIQQNSFSGLNTSIFEIRKDSAMHNLKKATYIINILTVIFLISSCDGDGSTSSSTATTSVSGIATPSNVSVVTAQNAGN